MTDVVETARRDVVVVDETTVEVIELLVQGPQGPPGSGGGSGGGGAPSGPAGGVLAGTYPDPGFAVDMATQAELDAEQTARIAADTILSTAVGQKQDAATAATDAELASAVSTLNTAIAAKQDAATAATDTELAAEATTRASADTTLTAAAAAAQSTANAALPKVGGTMIGDIVLAGDPTANLHPVTLQKLNAAIAALINSAPGALDTLGEIATRLGTDESAVSALSAQIAGALFAANNLSDLVNAGTARTNLGLGSAATHPATDFDAAGAAAAAQAASQPLDSDLTAIAALSTTAFGRALLVLADATAGRTALGLGTAALSATGDFDVAGAAAAVQAASQPLDSDLTAIATLTTTSYGRAFLALADAAAGRTALGLGTAATHATTDYDAAGAAAAAQAASQPLDSDLTAIAALTTTTFGRSLLAMADAAATKTALSLAKADVGLGSVDNTADTAKPVSTAQQTALDAILAVYRQVRAGATARGSTSAVAGTKYMLSIGSTADVVAPAANTSGAQQSVLIGIAAADYAVAGKTTKMRVKAHCSVATGPAVTITVGLYPVTGGASWSLGTVVAGSTVAFASPSSNTLTSGDSGDFTIPADGDYCLGYVVSGTPGAIFVLDGLLQVRNV